MYDHNNFPIFLFEYAMHFYKKKISGYCIEGENNYDQGFQQESNEWAHQEILGNSWP